MFELAASTFSNVWQKEPWFSIDKKQNTKKSLMRITLENIGSGTWVFTAYNLTPYNMITLTTEENSFQTDFKTKR